MIDTLWNCYSKTGTFACTKTLCRCIVITNNNRDVYKRQVVIPAMLVITDQKTLRIGRQSGLSGTGQAEEDSGVLAVHILSLIHIWQTWDSYLPHSWQFQS